MLFLDTLKVDASSASSQVTMRGSLISEGTDLVGSNSYVYIMPTYSNSNLTGLSLTGSITSNSSGETSETSSYDDLSIGGSYSVSNTTTGGTITIGSSGSITNSGSYGGTTERGAGTIQQYADGDVISSGTISMSENGSFSASLDVSETSVSGASYHITLPYAFGFNFSDALNPNAYYFLSLRGTAINQTYNDAITNLCILDNQHNLISYRNTVYKYAMVKGSDLLTNNGNIKRMLGFIDFYINVPNITDRVRDDFAIQYTYQLYNLKDEYKYTVGSTATSDTALQNLQQENNETTEDTNETTHNIFDSISSFFGSFFENIIQSLISVFVPEDGYFSQWFDRVNTLLADKLGVLYYPFNMIISFLNQISNSSSQSGQIVFPEVALPMDGQRYVIIERTTLNLADYDVETTSSENSSLVGTSGYTSVLSTIRTFSSFGVVLALVSLFLKKLNHIVNGEDA